MPILTAERLRELLHYDPETGVFTWRVNRRGHTRQGDIAGSGSPVVICLDCRKYLGHRLAWLYMMDQWPSALVDHVDLDSANNRWSNLRAATKSQNSANRLAQRNSRSGVKGVYWNPECRKWGATICLNYKRAHLGLFDNIEDASRAYENAARERFGEFARAA